MFYFQIASTMWRTQSSIVSQLMNYLARSFPSRCYDQKYSNIKPGQEYLTKRAKLFNPTKANPRITHGNPVNSSDTVYFTGMILFVAGPI